MLLKGPLHSGTQKGFARPDGPQEESPGLKRSGGLSPSRHNFLPQARTTSLRVCMCRQRALAPGTIGPASHLVLLLFRPGCRPQSRGLPCALRLHLPGSSCAACTCRRHKGKRQGKQAGQPPAACSKEDLLQEEAVRALKGVARQPPAPGSRPSLWMTIMLLASLGRET